MARMLCLCMFLALLSALPAQTEGELVGTNSLLKKESLKKLIGQRNDRFDVISLHLHYE